MRQNFNQHPIIKGRALILGFALFSFVPLPAYSDEQKPNSVAVASDHGIEDNQADRQQVPDYLDNRSTPETLIQSYYNAINRKEYARAYSYYSEEGRDPSFDVYMEGYKDTKFVRVKTGYTEPDPGAGQIYWSLPLAIEAEDNMGKKTVFTGCYTLRMTNPAMQEVPPFRPLQIMTGSLTPSPLDLEKSVPESCEAP